MLDSDSKKIKVNTFFLYGLNVDINLVDNFYEELKIFSVLKFKEDLLLNKLSLEDLFDKMRNYKICEIASKYFIVKKGTTFFYDSINNNIFNLYKKEIKDNLSLYLTEGVSFVENKLMKDCYMFLLMKNTENNNLQNFLQELLCKYYINNNLRKNEETKKFKEALFYYETNEFNEDFKIKFRKDLEENFKKYINSFIRYNWAAENNFRSSIISMINRLILDWNPSCQNIISSHFNYIEELYTEEYLKLLKENRDNLFLHFKRIESEYFLEILDGLFNLIEEYFNVEETIK